LSSWLITLPAPVVNGYALKPVDQTVRTDMEGGAARARRRTAARNDKVSASWVFTDAQMALFRPWFEDPVAGAGGGAVWFAISLPIGTGGVASVTARFIWPFTATYLAGMSWTVAAELEIR
jgi:hypothetical protein